MRNENNSQISRGYHACGGLHRNDGLPHSAPAGLAGFAATTGDSSAVTPLES
jgi:hypothetical protein